MRGRKKSGQYKPKQHNEVKLFSYINKKSIQVGCLDKKINK